MCVTAVDLCALALVLANGTQGLRQELRPQSGRASREVSRSPTLCDALRAGSVCLSPRVGVEGCAAKVVVVVRRFTRDVRRKISEKALLCLCLCAYVYEYGCAYSYVCVVLLISPRASLLFSSHALRPSPFLVSLRRRERMCSTCYLSGCFEGHDTLCFFLFLWWMVE